MTGTRSFVPRTVKPRSQPRRVYRRESRPHKKALRAPPVRRTAAYRRAERRGGDSEPLTNARSPRSERKKSAAIRRPRRPSRPTDREARRRERDERSSRWTRKRSRPNRLGRRRTADRTTPRRCGRRPSSSSLRPPRASRSSLRSASEARDHRPSRLDRIAWRSDSESFSICRFPSINTVGVERTPDSTPA